MVARAGGPRMGSLEERVAYLEGRGEEHAASLGEVRADIRDLRADMNRRFDQMDTKFSWLIGVQFTGLFRASAAVLAGSSRCPPAACLTESTHAAPINIDRASNARPML